MKVNIVFGFKPSFLLDVLEQLYTYKYKNDHMKVNFVLGFESSFLLSDFEQQYDQMKVNFAFGFFILINKKMTT